jgi:uncharacterized membrane protein YfcA
MILSSLMLALVGMLAGAMGAILVPALTLLFQLPIRAAVGASLIGVIATSAGVASVSRPGRGADIGLALRLELATATGALLASSAAGRLSQQALMLVFSGVVLVTAVYTYSKTRRKPSTATDNAVEALFHSDYQPRHWAGGLAFSGLAGILSGLTGVGGGFVKVPVMYSLMEVPLGVATASSNFMVGITAAASAMVYYSRGDVYPLVAVPTALGVFLGAVAGVRLVPRLPVDSLRKALIVVLVLVALQMAWKGITGT